MLSVFTYLAKWMERNDPFDIKQKCLMFHHKGHVILTFEKNEKSRVSVNNSAMKNEEFSCERV